MGPEMKLEMESNSGKNGRTRRGEADGCHAWMPLLSWCNGAGDGSRGLKRGVKLRNGIESHGEGC